MAEAGTSRLLGVQAVAAEADEIIQTAAIAIRAGMPCRTSPTNCSRT